MNGTHTTTAEVKSISLAVIDYEALADNNTAEKQKLLRACQEEGMFYLDLRGPRTAAIFDDVPAVFKTGNQFFNLPAESDEKTHSIREGRERGYHANKALEYYEIARDEFQLGKWVFPATIEPEKERLTRMLKSFNDAAQTILAELCGALDFQIAELSDDPTVASDTALKLLFKPAVHEVGAVVLGRHTDFGLLTLLWYDEATTQLPVCDETGAETGAWAMVPAMEGAILVNVADGLEEKSGGRLHSTVHRVICPPGPKRTKNGLVYFLRPYKT